jgi:hypothetical protein
MSLANLFCLLSTPNGYQFVLAAYVPVSPILLPSIHSSIHSTLIYSHQGVAHSALTNRMFLNLRKLAAKDTEFASELVTRELKILNALQRTTDGTVGSDRITTRSIRTQRLPSHPRQEFELRKSITVAISTTEGGEVWVGGESQGDTEGKRRRGRFELGGCGE